MIYYIDSKFGNDSNDGLSRQFPLKTLEGVNALTLKGGDKVLFKCGQTFEGCLHPRREADDGMITIDSFGFGEKPIIMGNSDYAVFLENISGVELLGLAVKNPYGNTAIRVENNAGGVMEHIHIRKCSISDVNIDRHRYDRFEGGICCASASDEAAGPSWFNDLLIENNDIINVGRTGIVLGGNWANRWRDEKERQWGYNKWKNDNEGWWPSYGVVIRGNYLDHIGGDGIFIIGTVDAVIEWNTVYHIDTRVGKKEANAGIWCQSSNNCLIQFNESAYALKPEGCGDCQGFDIDYTCRDTIVQYNYSHDNGGGFITQTALLSNSDGEFGGSIIRNNLSVNDGHIHGEIFCLWGPNQDVIIENNTIVAGRNVDRILGTWNSSNNVTFRKNIFMNNGPSSNFNMEQCTNMKLEGNLYCGWRSEINPLDKEGYSFDPAFKIVFDERVSRDGMDTFFDYVPLNKEILLKEDKSDKPYLGALYPKD